MEDLKINHVIFRGYLLIFQFSDCLTKAEKSHILFFKKCRIIAIAKTIVILAHQKKNFLLNDIICRKIFKQKFLYRIVDVDSPIALASPNVTTKNNNIDLKHFAFLPETDHLIVVNSPSQNHVTNK